MNMHPRVMESAQFCLNKNTQDQEAWEARASRVKLHSQERVPTAPPLDQCVCLKHRDLIVYKMPCTNRQEILWFKPKPVLFHVYREPRQRAKTNTHPQFLKFCHLFKIHQEMAVSEGWRGHNGFTYKSILENCLDTEGMKILA